MLRSVRPAARAEAKDSDHVCTGCVTRGVFKPTNERCVIYSFRVKEMPRRKRPNWSLRAQSLAFMSVIASRDMTSAPPSRPA